MATNLTTLKIKDTFSQLLHIDAGPEATPKTVYSATGTATALKVGTANIEVDNIRIDGNTISATNSNGDLIVVPNGTGSVIISKATISSGSVTGITDLLVADGGTGVSTLTGIVKGNGTAAFTAATAGTDYLAPAAIGTTVQAYDAGLQSIAGLTTSSNQMIYTTASDTYAATSLTAFGRSLIDDADAATARTTIGMGTIASQDASTVAITGGSVLATTNLGFNTGGGGTVTQATDKTTGVTLNKPTGRITMAAGNLPNGNAVSFTLTNSSIGANDVVVASIMSGATADSYNIDVTATAAGSCRIQVHNLTTGAINEQPVIQFVVIKGAIA